MATSKRRSKFEVTAEKVLKGQGAKRMEYEALSVPFSVPHRYIPDVLLPNGIILEFKGYFRPEARREMVAVRKEHPTLDIRMVFQRAKTALSKGSKNTYAAWCDKHGILWADIKDVATLNQWIRDPHDPVRWATANLFRRST